MRKFAKRPHSGRKDTRAGAYKKGDSAVEDQLTGKYTDKYKAKKSLGQHFLTSQSALDKIIGATEISSRNTVVEVGPGKGILTERLLAVAGKVIAVEKDIELITLLNEKFSSEIEAGKLLLINSDILDPELSLFSPSAEKGNGAAETGSVKYKVTANIPYYITNAIIRLFLENDAQPEEMVILIQKEVAERIIAKDGKESLLSIAVKAYGTPRLIAKVPAGSFNPPPKVDSAILLIQDISKKNFENMGEKAFFEVVRAGFAHKRKKLAGNLTAIYTKEAIETAFQNLNMSVDIRSEDISLEEWKKIVRELIK